MDRREKISESMTRIRSRRAIRNRPKRCQCCGEPTRAARLDLFRGRWLCGECLNADCEPIWVDSVVYARGDEDPRIVSKQPTIYAHVN